MNDIFEISDGAKTNYMATICQLGKVYPIEGASRLSRTVVNGYDIVIGSDMKESDYVVYFPAGCAICERYLSANNLYKASKYLNANKEEARRLINEGNARGADRISGFFEPNGRVKSIRLRGCTSNGYVADVASLIMFDASLAGIDDWSEYSGTSFDTVNGEKLCWKYFEDLPVNDYFPVKSKEKMKNKVYRKYSVLRKDDFKFHYEVQHINSHMDLFSYDDMVNISVKVHGASGVFSNVLCNRVPTFFENFLSLFGYRPELTEYRNIYSSRTVIKNPGFGHNEGFYGVNIWKKVNRVIHKHLDKGMTVYGEIVGYLDKKHMIQEKYDYGCKPGQWKFMPYRITTDLPEGGKREWGVYEVYSWTIKLINDYPKLAKNIMPIEILYNGTLSDLYPDITIDQKWRENVLEALKNDKNFGMEEKEPLCTMAVSKCRDMALSGMDIDWDEYFKNEVPPREGIVIRRNGDSVPEAWKLKCSEFLMFEDRIMSEGVVDTEEAEELAAM